MKVTTESERIERHRRVLYGLYLADHQLYSDGLPIETGNGNQLRELATETNPIRLEPVHAPRVGRPQDVNPYIAFEPDLCILCARCTRYCDEVEAVNAAVLSNKCLQFAGGSVYIHEEDTGERWVKHIHDAKLDALKKVRKSVKSPLLVAYSFRRHGDVACGREYNAAVR